MSMLAEQVQIQRVENGWVVTVWWGGTHLMLVAKSVQEIAGFISGMEWQAPRPLDFGGGGVAQQAAAPRGASSGVPGPG